VHARLFSQDYINGVKEFMSFIHGKFGEDEEILCPCSRCLNQKYQHQALVERHILMNGMQSTYTRWIHHGENFDVYANEHSVEVHEYDSLQELGMNEHDNYSDGNLNELLQDLHNAEKDKEDGENENDAEPSNNGSFLKIVMKDAKRQLYPGCTKFSKLTFVVKLLHMKSFYRISNSAFSAILKLLVDAFPECNTLPKSYYEAKTLLKELGLGYELIHVSYNNCVVFRKKYAKLDNCPFCGLSRWVGAERKKIPQKVLRYFPLIPRLQRMFVNKEAAEQA
jgi:hypothetical protein